MEAQRNNGKLNGHSNGVAYSFDDFALDPSNRTCSCQGHTLPLTGKVFDILVVFAQNPGRLVTKDDLIEKVWNGDFVEEGTVARHVSTLRKALGENGDDRKFIVTVQGHGYRFVGDVKANVKTNGAATQQLLEATEVAEIAQAPSSPSSKKWLWVAPVVIVMVASAWIAKVHFATPRNQINSLAVLPLKSLDKNDAFLGAGIADAVISRVSQTRQLTVKPTSAVLKFLKDDTDSLAAARQLNVDAVLEGSVQRAGDRIRISLNLLRVSDGSSLWTENFDMSANDVFAMQDKVGDDVAKRLELRLDPSESGSAKSYPTNPIAYEFYIKGVYSLDGRTNGVVGMPQMQTTIDYFKKAIELEPNYALAHAQLAFTYVWTAVSVDATNPKWADLAREEINRAQQLDPNLAQTHIAKGLLYWTSFEGYQNEAAIRELLLAKQIDPNNVDADLPAIYQHLGLDDLAARELKHALEVDPTSQALKDLSLISLFLQAKPDEWLAAREKLRPNGTTPLWYQLRKGRLVEAQKQVDDLLAKGNTDPELMITAALLKSLKGDYQGWDKSLSDEVARIPRNSQTRHHTTYDVACAYAVAGKSAEAVRWLKETANTGFPNYPLFERDPFLDRIRKAPEFVQFMGEQRANWQKLHDEFSGQ